MVAAPGGMSAVTGLVPRQLPVGVRHFAGRTAELKVLDGLLTESADGVQPVIAVICGTAGVGKTALAVHWAQRSAERFPDGQLYVNLRGFAPSATLITPSEAIGAFLAALHVPPETLPAGLDARSALLRSLVAGKRVLFVLDNARDAGQVRPLLPGSPGCMVLVTSRSQLTGLVSAAGAELLILDTLPENEARELLADRVGADRVAAEPLAVAELTGLCARLPLALSVVAARASSHPGHPLAVLVAEVRDAGNRLNALSTGDAGTSVRAVLSWSYWNLGESAKRMFRLLGLHPGPDISTAAAAALAGVTPETGAGLLRELTGACLLTEDIPGRFACHDLLKAYAREQAGNNDSDTEQSRALTSVFDYYLMASAAAMDALMPAEQHRRSSPHGICPAAFALSGPAAARGWLDAERPTLLAVIAQAAAHGWPGHVCRMATILFRYLDIGGYHQESATIQALALRAALRTGDRAAQASALLGLGGTDWRLRRYDEADRHLRDALTIFAGLGDQSGQARTLANLGVVESCRGRHERAAELHREALAIFRETGDRLGQARALETLGLALCQQGRQQQASGLQRQALDLYRELGERHGEARMLESIGVTDWALGRHDEAAAHFLAAIAIFDETGDILGQAHALGNLAAEEGWQGRYGKATEYQAAAITLFRQVGDRSGEARVLSARGDVLSVAGQTALAREHWEHALAIYSDLGAPEAALLRARLNDDREAVGVPGGLDVGGPVVGLGMDDG
jgi:tetratricopeptide (TPR) repeat protein